VEWQANATGRKSYVLKSLAQNGINQMSLRIGSKHAYLTHISSFFLHNHVPWPPDSSFRFSSNHAPVEGKLTLEAFKRILLNCDKRYRAVFLMQAQMLAGPGDVIYVSNHYRDEILQHLTKNDGVFKITLHGRKRNKNTKNFYTLLNTKSDWGNAMKKYLKSVARIPDKALFVNDRGAPLTRQNIEWYFHKRAVEAGIIRQKTPECPKCGAETLWSRSQDKVVYQCKETQQHSVFASELNINLRGNRYGVNPHEIRDLMRSRWRASGAKTVVAEFMMGHEIDANAYDKMKYTPSDAITEYRKALSWLNLLSHDPEKVDRAEIDSKLEERDAEVEVLRRELSRVQKGMEKLSWLADPEKAKDILEGLRLLREKERN